MDEKEISDLRSDGSNDFSFPWLCHPGSPKAGNRGHPAGRACELSRSIEEMISHGDTEMEENGKAVQPQRTQRSPRRRCVIRVSEFWPLRPLWQIPEF